MIPNPRFVVFYNGVDSQPERQTLKLSDAYEKKQDEPELELIITVYNVNCGFNEEAHHKLLYEEGREAGLEQGEIRLARVNKFHSILIDLDRIADLKRATQDNAYQEQLMSELLPEEMLNI